MDEVFNAQRCDSIFFDRIPGTMKHIFFLLLLSSPCWAQGSERWTQKTLKDGFVPSKPVNSTIHAERLLTAPSKWGESLVRQPLEKTIVRISGNIIAVGVESDSDLHLEFSDGKETEVTEIPLPKFMPARYAKQCSDARAFIVKQIGYYPKKIKKLSEPFRVTLTGVRFSDKKLHGTGGSINGVEILLAAQ